MLVTWDRRPNRFQRLGVFVRGAAQHALHVHWVDHLAHLLSQVASPPVLALLMVGLCAASLPQANVWRWATLHAGLTVVLPITFLVWLWARGMVSDLDVCQRKERARPMLAALGGAATSLILLRLGSAPQLLLGIGMATFLQLALVFIVTLRWKISVHTTAAASFAVLMWGLLGAVAWLGVIPLIAWARLHLKRHTLAQTIAGALWGGLSMTIALTFGR